MEKDTERVIISVFPIKKSYKCILIRVRTLLEIIQAMTKIHLNALRNAGPDLRQTDRQTERQPLFIKHNKNSVVCVILHNTGN